MLTWRENLSTLLGHRQQDGPRWQETREVDYVAGCALLARREVLEKAGLFDAQFFAYMEDVDLCLRAHEAGFGVRLVGEAAAYHATSSATGGGYNPRRKYMMGVNSIWFCREQGLCAAYAPTIVQQTSADPPVYLVELLFSFKGVKRVEVPQERIQPH